MFLMGIDVGTTGCKAVVFTETGEQAGSGYREYGIETDDRGKAEQDAEEVWLLTKEVMKEAAYQAAAYQTKSAGGSRTDTIGALSISVQGDAIIPVDSDGNALAKALMGMDYRSHEEVVEAVKLMGDRKLFERTGMRPHPINSLIKAMYLKKAESSIYEKSHKITTYADFILRKLGAGWVIDYPMASRTMGFDLKQTAWSDEIFTTLGIEAAKWSRAVPSGTEVGKLAPDVAAETGIPPGCVVVTGGHDQTCAALGAGVIREGMAVASTGTAEVFSTTFPNPKLDRSMFDSYYPCYLHTVPNMYFTFSLNHVGGLLLRWFRDNFCRWEEEEARKAGVDVYDYLLRNIPKEPTGLFFLPHLNGSGTPWCDLSSKGALVGMKLSTTKEDMLRSLLESLTYELAINVETMEQSGIVVEDVAAVGGGARSPEWLRMKADILGRPVRTLRCKESACLGAALLAGFGAGLLSSIKEGVAAAVRYEKTYEPRTDYKGRYQEKLALYREVYPALKTINARL